MNSDALSLLTNADSYLTLNDALLNQYTLIGLATLSSINLENNTATARVYLNSPMNVYEERTVEVLTTGVNTPTENSLCLVFSPKTAVMVGGKETTLVNSARPYDVIALKAIPLLRLSEIQEYGVGSSSQKASLYGPDVEVKASADGTGLFYNGEEGKAGAFLDGEGNLNLFNGFAWIQFKKDEEIQIHAEDDTVTTESTITPKGLSFKVKKTPSTEEEQEQNYLSIEVDENGVLTIKQGEEERVVISDTEGITVADKSQNKIEMTSAGVTVTDANQHTITMGASSIKLQGTSGSVEIM